MINSELCKTSRRFAPFACMALSCKNSGRIPAKKVEKVNGSSDGWLALRTIKQWSWQGGWWGLAEAADWLPKMLDRERQ